MWAPGEYLVIDWADVGAGLHLFCAVLAWSRWRFVAFATDERATTTLALIAEALAAAGGVPAQGPGRPDGVPEGRGRRERGRPDPGLRPVGVALRVRPGLLPRRRTRESKGIVENLVGYAQRDLVVPLLTEAASGRPAGRACTRRTPPPPGGAPR